MKLFTNNVDVQLMISLWFLGCLTFLAVPHTHHEMTGLQSKEQTQVAQGASKHSVPRHLETQPSTGCVDSSVHWVSSVL